MKRRRFSRRMQLASAGALLVGALIAVQTTGGQPEEEPASPAVLNGIAFKNREAAIDAAARFKTDAKATSRAAEFKARTEGSASTGTADGTATAAR